MPQIKFLPSEIPKLLEALKNFRKMNDQFIKRRAVMEAILQDEPEAVQAKELCDSVQTKMESDITILETMLQNAQIGVEISEIEKLQQHMTNLGEVESFWHDIFFEAMKRIRIKNFQKLEQLGIVYDNTDRPDASSIIIDGEKTQITDHPNFIIDPALVCIPVRLTLDRTLKDAISRTPSNQSRLQP